MKILRIITFSFFVINLSATIINIPADQSTVQNGIDIAVNGDTVLVHPGTYFENIDYCGKLIIVASLFLTTQDTTYISQTIIDGNNSESVVGFQNQENETAVLCGFTIKNGNGSSINIFGGNDYYRIGSGIYCIWNSNPTLSNLKITANVAIGHSMGGGIFIYQSSPNVYESEIFDNDVQIGNGAGGGLYCLEGSPSLSNLIIKNNQAGKGGGLLFSGATPVLSNILVEYNYATSRGAGVYAQNLSQIQFEEVTIRYNNSDGRGGGIYLSEESIINFSETNLSNLYLNNALFGKDIFDANVIEMRTQVILDTFTVLYPSSFYVTPLDNFSFTIQNSKIQQVDADLYVAEWGDNQNGGLSNESPLRTIIYAQSIIRAENGNNNSIHIDQGIYSPVTNGEQFPLFIVQNVDYIGHRAEDTILDAGSNSRILAFWEANNTKIENLTLRNGSDPLFAGAVYCYKSSPVFNKIILANSVVNNPEPGQSARGGIIYLISGSNAIFTNVTFVDNDVLNSPNGCTLYSISSNPIIINSIFWNQSSIEICTIFDDSFGDDSSIVITYSNLKNGESGIVNEGSNLYFLDGNINIDPLFSDQTQQNYSLQTNSPCIDTGTAYYDYEGEILIDLNEEEYYGSAPDMGAFEWQGVDVEDEIILILRETRISNYPNPFNPSTTISFSLPEECVVNLSVYNLKGQKIKTLAQNEYTKGTHSIVWNGTDDSGEFVSTGIYCYKLNVNGETEAFKKCLLLK
jgi:flagellar hook capping protein FlgD